MWSNSMDPVHAKNRIYLENNASLERSETHTRNPPCVGDQIYAN